MKLLLHACCGVCAGQTIEKLKSEFDEIIVYFYNPNIWPEEEYEKRKVAMEQVARYHQVKFLEGPFNHQAWLEEVKGLEKEPEGGQRCEVCYRMRLVWAAQEARKENCDFFATTLSISPRKKAETINRLGREAGEKEGVKFYEADFKKQDGFKKTCELARQLELYRQTYCGCEFS